MAWYKTGGEETHKYDSGTVTVSSSETVKVTLGYKPRFVNIWFKKGNNVFGIYYSEDNYPDYQMAASEASSDSVVMTAVPTTSGNRIKSIDDDGFTLNTFVSSTINAYGSSGKWIAGK